MLRQPLSASLTVLLIFVLALAGGIWLGIARFSRVEAVPGVLETEIPTARVYTPTSGLVQSFAQHEGDFVAKGTVLARISIDRTMDTGGGSTASSIRALDKRLSSAEEQVSLSRQKKHEEEARLRRIIASIGTEIGAIQSERDLQQQIIVSSHKTFDDLSKVVGQGFISRYDYERRRQAIMAAEQGLSSLKQQLAAKTSELVEYTGQLNALSLTEKNEIAQIEQGRGLMAQDRGQLQGQMEFSIVAPISGFVTAIQTAPGRMVLPNIPLLTLVPAHSPIVVQLYAPPRSVGFVSPGQEVHVLLDAFPYQKYGGQTGEVVSISKVAIDPREADVPIKLEGPVYRITVKLKNQTVAADGRNRPLQPGMTLIADILLERQTFIAWLLAPLRAHRTGS